MIVSKVIRVRCTGGQCERPADADVAVERVADGVVARPRLLCESCGSELQEVDR